MSAAELCQACGSALKPGAAFCTACGQRRPVAPGMYVAAQDPPPLSRKGSGELGVILVYYLLMLAVQAALMIYVRVTDESFEGMVAATAASAAITVGVALWHRGLLGGAYGRAGFSFSGYALILGAAPVIVLLVAAYVAALKSYFGIDMPGDLDGFEGHSLAWAFLLVIVAAPLEEELGFRGVLYGGLRRGFGTSEAFLVSSFAFALLHLSIPSLVTHFPLGLYFCWLRHRSGSLWPPTFAHFCHNLLVVIAEHQGWTS